MKNCQSRWLVKCVMVTKAMVRRKLGAAFKSPEACSAVTSPVQSNYGRKFLPARCSISSKMVLREPVWLAHKKTLKDKEIWDVVKYIRSTFVK